MCISDVFASVIIIKLDDIIKTFDECYPLILIHFLGIATLIFRKYGTPRRHLKIEFATANKIVKNLFKCLYLCNHILKLGDCNYYNSAIDIIF